MLDLGLTTYGNRAVAQEPERARELVPDIQAVRCVVAGVVVVLAVVGLSGVTGQVTSGTTRIVLISLLWVLPFEGAPEWFFLGSQRMSIVSLGKLLLFGAVLVFTLVTVRGPGGVAMAAFARVMGGVVWAACLLALLPKGLLTLGRAGVRRALGRVRQALPFWWLAIVTQVFVGVDVVMLGIWRAPEEVGIYAAAFRLVAFLLLGISLINTAVFPMVAAAGQRGASALVAIVKLYWMVALAVAACLLLVGLPMTPMFLKLAYGDGFRAAVPLMRILIVGSAIQTLNGALAQPLLAVGKEMTVTPRAPGPPLSSSDLTFWQFRGLGRPALRLCTAFPCWSEHCGWSRRTGDCATLSGHRNPGPVHEEGSLGAIHRGGTVSVAIGAGVGRAMGRVT